MLDTHIAIWSLLDSPRLSVPAREIIRNAENTIHVSAATLWEIAIKYALGRKTAPPIPAAEASRAFHEAGFRFVDVTAAHALTVESLPSLHGDPFDRLLIAQALTEPLRLLTHDRQVAAYSDTVLLV
ncbi:PIN domain nuclease [Kaistia algarum]|nr:PIN domain nuclease [Kaistia algarum]